MTYHYFVSYRWWSPNASGFGRSEATIDKPIKNMEQIAEIERAVAEIATPQIVEMFDEEPTKLVVLNYQLLRKELF